MAEPAFRIDADTLRVSPPTPVTERVDLVELRHPTARQRGTRRRPTFTRLILNGHHGAVEPPPLMRRSQVRRALRAALAIAALLLLGALLTLPLGWKEQAIFGTALIAAAMFLNRAFRSPTVTLTLMGISMFSTLRYGYWRTTQTWEGITSAGHLYQWDTAFVLLLLFAEFYAFTTLALGYFQTLRPLRRRPVPLRGHSQHWPTVDVFIPTYNEPLSVVRATVMGALAMDYPANKMNVVVLDDGHREEFGEFAARVGAGYLTRDHNAHAKAGNINHALARTNAEYIAIFDCDHVPTRSFLQMTLGWFVRDPRLGLLQTPHHFYSPDPIERNLGQFRKIPNESELFHRLIQDGNDLWNASFFCGSCAVMRRKALGEVGGIAVETVTEDAHTALRMQRRGWNSAYINIPQAAGLATESLAAHIGQRIRWARGMVQILRLENPLFGPGLSLPQRLCYFNAATHFLFAVPRLIFLTVPLVYLLLGMVNIYGYSLAVFAYAFPHIVLANVANARVQRRYRFSFWSEIYETVLAPYILVPTLLALINPRLGKFNVTSKGGVIRRSYFDLRIAMPFLVLLALNIAGLVMAERRWMTDPAHHDTVLMNALWTVYNVLILSVAASVAWERRQRRSEVRVRTSVGLTLITRDGRRLAAAAGDLSRRGAVARVETPTRLQAGAPVAVVFEEPASSCDIPARVVRSAGRRQHLTFPRLELWQEEYLLGRIYSPPEAWLSWHTSRALDRPLRSLIHIIFLGIRGLFLVPCGLFAPAPATPRSTAQPNRPRKRATTVAAGVLVFGLLTPDSLAAPVDQRSGVPEAAGSTATTFQESYELSAIGLTVSKRLDGVGASQNLFFDVPLTKIIGNATLRLRYAAPMLTKDEGTLDLWLNGTYVTSMRLDPGTDLQADVALPTDLLKTTNSLTLQLGGRCDACERNRASWMTIDPKSTLSITGSKLPIPVDLALLPVPFLDPTGQRPWSLPVVFSSWPELTTVQAAAVVASWFGVFSDVRGVDFSVHVGNLPEGNALVLVVGGSQLARTLSIPAQSGALVALRENPRDPYGRLLIVAGDEPADILTAARALVTRQHFPASAKFIAPRDVEVPTRQKYAAPRWLETDKPAPIGMYTSAERLKLKGSGSVTMYFRLPPDLFLAAKQSVPLLLKYGYAGVAEGADASVHVRLNDQDVDTIRLRPSSSYLERADIVRLPTGRLRPYANALTVDIDFGNRNHPSDILQFAAIYRDSSIDFHDVPHAVVLPRLELFADSGFPFTAWPDLSRTAVVVSSSPTVGEYEALLNTSAFFGAQTGASATAIVVTDASNVAAVRDKDLVVLGSPASQPLLSKWRDRLPLEASSDGRRVNPRPMKSRWLHPEWPFRERDGDRLADLVAARPRLDVIVEQFVSPLRADRSVVVMVPGDAGNYDGIPAMFMPAVRNGPVYGGVALAQDGQFQSFLVGHDAYHFGDGGLYARGLVFLLEHYRYLPAFVLVLALIIAFEVRQDTERVAARRISTTRI